MFNPTAVDDLCCMPSAVVPPSLPRFLGSPITVASNILEIVDCQFVSGYAHSTLAAESSFAAETKMTLYRVTVVLLARIASFCTARVAPFHRAVPFGATLPATKNVYGIWLLRTYEYICSSGVFLADPGIDEEVLGGSDGEGCKGQDGSG